MRKMLEIALNDLRIIFREKGIFLNIVIIPIAIAVAVGFGSSAMAGGGSALLRVDVIDADQSALSAGFLDAVRAANPNIVLCPLDNDEDDVCGLGDETFDETLAEERLRVQTSLALIVIPAGFEAALNSGESVNVVYRSNERATAPSYILQAVQAAAQQVGGALVASRVGTDVIQTFTGSEDDSLRQTLYDRAESLWNAEPITVSYVQGAAVEQPSNTGAGFGQSIPGISTMYVMFSVFPVVVTFLNERKNWTFQRMIVMPLSRWQVLGGKLLARFTLGMIQFAVLFGFGLVLGLRYGDNLPGLILVMAAYTAAITALTLALMTFIRSQQQADGLTLFLTMVLAPLGGAWWSLDIVPDWMRVVGHLSPVAWAMDGFHSLIFFGGDLASIALPVLVLLGMTAVLFVIGVARFRYE